MRRVIFALLLLLLSPFAAEAVGPVVATGCIGSWNPVTTNTDGTLISLPVTYNVYVVSGVQTAPAVPPKLTASGLTVPLCSGLAAGQYTAFVSAVAGGVEGAVSPAFPFVLSLVLTPVAPSNVIVR